MATLPSEIPVLSDGAGLPNQADNTVASGLPSRMEADALALEIANQHRRGRKRKKQRDLLAEMYMMHLDGEGDAQWVTILNGERLRVAPNLDGGTRCTSNLLRPITGNFVSYQTSIPYRVIADPKADRQSRDKAKIDTIYANHVIQQQRLNELFAEACFMAVPYGFCPIHASAREDLAAEAYQSPSMPQGIRPIYIDCWVGDPFSMVFNSGATRRSVSWTTYERVLPLSVVLAAFPNVEWIGDLKGRNDLPSASRFQMTARRWLSEATHGTPVLQNGQTDDESVALVCYELAPGIDPDYPEGRSIIVALSNVADSGNNSIGTPMLLHDGPLPGRRFSFSRLYTDHRFDDPYGYPWITPLDELQVRRNNLETLLVNGGIRSAHPQLALGPAGGGDDDTLGFEPDGIIESIDNFRPGYLEYPTRWMSAIEARLQATEEKMFQIGGWQAASRGESKSGQPYAAIVQLQNADDSVHGPANRSIVGTISEYLQLVHTLTREFNGPFPIPVRVAGDDYAYLKQSYITADQLSEEPPSFVVVSGFGSTKEDVAQRLVALAQARGADGTPLLTTKQLRKQYPDQSIWPIETDIEEVKKRRAQAINYMIRDLCAEFEKQNPQINDLPPQWLESVAHQILAQLDATEPIARDDIPQLNIDTLSEIVQDTSETKLVRRVAALRQDMNYQWMAAIAEPQTKTGVGGNASPVTKQGAQPNTAATQMPAQGAM